MAKSRRAPAKGHNRLRIIGGRWRGRRLAFPPVEGLRPSTDRVRETLFNWLQPVLPGARCLDLFCGSGALGLEALSREAAQVVFVDRERRVIEQIRAHFALLGAAGGETVQADVLAYLRGPARPFDIVFLDPPFRQGLLGPCCEALAAGDWLAPGAHIYLEAEAQLGEPALPEGWALQRSKRAGDVGYHLARVE